ncbi:MAG: zinc ABC transporter substrate-binding protein [Gammaproteobacteria bacterium]|nr:zinc ABC transporter substrate-binding protein [Rhodocyclaceae bacterium]MBU3910717.1 zinc ABC transporter substrate-binding protein [Gammaproteobacteria bacterium]MBU3988497.1 zinc ABC transporter substrate-binding protein [Gammaproteobacteria bacterium]MBU4003426.1 zinc ABC transporter substrate-binding protein [Gammaproteobacteria bacterium]MBU4021897.1 zinc ABC transporter substrate-binding protein [Gammaproteobacteria bacterium]
MRILLLLLASLLALPAQAGLKIFATVPEWGALAREIGGDKAEVFVATSGLQDPHHIQARPSLIARARSADLLVATGAELEIGWLPLVQRESGNAHIQAGQTGYFEAARQVAMRELPARVDRAEGDVHAGGNPHIQTDPRNFLLVGAALTERMATLAPADAATYRANWQVFATRWRAAISRWEKQAAPLRGLPIAVQHKAFPYLEDWLGLKTVAVLEPKPGVEPSVAYLGKLLAQAAATPPRLVLRAAYQSPQAAAWFARAARVPVVVVPFTVGGSEQAQDLFGLFDDTVERLLAAVK